MNRIKYIVERIEAKKADYLKYDFIERENNALKTFFDLAQEFDGIEDFTTLCVMIPKSFFNLEARLYLIDPKENSWGLDANTKDESYHLKGILPDHMEPKERPYYTDKESLVLPIRGKELGKDLFPFEIKDGILGLLELYPVKEMSEHQELFFEKYANRIGFNLHNRYLVKKNIEHLRFIRSLVADIEHNIIVPNMVYKLYLRRLGGKVSKNKELEQLFSRYSDEGQCDVVCFKRLLGELDDVNQGLTIELENLEKHYHNMSLFIETLFRRSHFDQGRLTIRTKKCNMEKDVVQPQLEQYIEQFNNAGISIDDQLAGIPEEEIINVVDVGLMAQVYANLFSNAIKYTQEVVIEKGDRKKFLSYGRETIKDFFGSGRDGMKYNVFTTGQHIPPEERDGLFEEEHRGSNALNKPGTGHGLAFIKNAVEIHGGVVGYEATRYGNNFYFVLPR
jgi:signal transduction histidine kinase